MIQNLEAALVRNEEVCRILEGMPDVDNKLLTERRSMCNELREMIRTLYFLSGEVNASTIDNILFNYMFKREMLR